jgi:hypothetical protein
VLFYNTVIYFVAVLCSILRYTVLQSILSFILHYFDGLLFYAL